MLQRHIYKTTLVLGSLLVGVALFSLSAQASSVAQVKNVEVTNVTTVSADVTWDEVDAADYYLLKLKNKKGKQLGAVQVAPYNLTTLDNLKPDKTYKVKVRVVEGTTKGDWSDSVSFTTDASDPDDDANGDGYDDAANATLALGDDFILDAGSNGRQWWGVATIYYGHLNPDVDQDLEQVVWTGRIDQSDCTSDYDCMTLMLANGNGSLLHKEYGDSTNTWITYYNKTKSFGQNYEPDGKSISAELVFKPATYEVTLLSDDASFNYTDPNGNTGTAEFRSFSAGNNLPDLADDYCETLVGDNSDLGVIASASCPFTLTTSGSHEGIMKGYLSDTANDGATLIRYKWRFYPTTCAAFTADCVVPEVAQATKADYVEIGLDKSYF